MLLQWDSEDVFGPEKNGRAHTSEVVVVGRGLLRCVWCCVATARDLSFIVKTLFHLGHVCETCCSSFCWAPSHTNARVESGFVPVLVPAVGAYTAAWMRCERTRWRLALSFSSHGLVPPSCVTELRFVLTGGAAGAGDVFRWSDTRA